MKLKPHQQSLPCSYYSCKKRFQTTVRGGAGGVRGSPGGVRGESGVCVCFYTELEMYEGKAKQSSKTNRALR